MRGQWPTACCHRRNTGPHERAERWYLTQNVDKWGSMEKSQGKLHRMNKAEREERLRPGGKKYHQTRSRRRIGNWVVALERQAGSSDLPCFTVGNLLCLIITQKSLIINSAHEAQYARVIWGSNQLSAYVPSFLPHCFPSSVHVLET